MKTSLQHAVVGTSWNVISVSQVFQHTAYLVQSSAPLAPGGSGFTRTGLDVCHVLHQRAVTSERSCQCVSLAM